MVDHVMWEDREKKIFVKIKEVLSGSALWILMFCLKPYQMAMWSKYVYLAFISRMVLACSLCLCL
jgi:hypothetical protein